ncbi:MAG: 3-deoxy-D-manno-octulosonic acid transferase [Cypionkella sp.]|nr:3-deoxy-D-manno-octulosonic acid transferase [Cypionkella sp.]
MAPSLGLTLYTLRPGRETGVQVERPARPEGGLIWMHAPAAETARGLMELAVRLVEEDGLAVLITCPDPLPQRPGVILAPPPADTLTEARAFLDHWKPSVGIFSDGELRPALIHEVADRSIPLMLVDGRVPRLPRDRDGWYPGLMRASLQAFAHVATLDEASARAFRKAGARLSAVEVTGRLEEDSAALPCLEAERAALARLLSARPVWLAAALPEAEEEIVLAAHRAALGLAHRLLLIIAPEDAARATVLTERLIQEGQWVIASRAEDQEPEPEVEIFVADGTAELGLWYRLAPVTFMGGSLAGSGCLRDPMEPAALGSAILYGPRPGPYGSRFGRLGAARAARAVGNGRDLADALSDLMAPDRVARLAQAAWGVVSEGADVTEHTLGQIRSMMKGKP